MDEATRKTLEDAYSHLMRAAKNIRRLLDGEQAQRVTTQDLRFASIAGVAAPEMLQKPADAQGLHD